MPAILPQALAGCVCHVVGADSLLQLRRLLKHRRGTDICPAAWSELDVPALLLFIGLPRFAARCTDKNQPRAI